MRKIPEPMIGSTTILHKGVQFLSQPAWRGIRICSDWRQLHPSESCSSLLRPLLQKGLARISYISAR
jgi:hypothetical protein